jgi:hypothetical protein
MPQAALRPLLLIPFLLAGCTTDSTPRYALSSDDTGVFRSANPGRPIAMAQIKAMDEQQIANTFGIPKLDRRDASSRVLRYSSDACTLFIYVQGGRAQYADAYDPQMRSLSTADQCAGSVAAQKRIA